MSANELAKEYVVIVGLGTTGQSIARYLRSRGLNFIAFDTRNSESVKTEFARLFPGGAIYLGDMPSALWLGAQEIYLSPGVAREFPPVASAIQQGKSVVGDIELFMREVTKPVIGVTGSNGKSTVVTLLGRAAETAGLRVAVGGNIGVPALDLLTLDAELYVLELSSFQLESTQTLDLQVACNLNVSPDHLDRYASMADYTRAKQRIFLAAQHCVFNFEDEATRPAENCPGEKIGFGLAKNADSANPYYSYDRESGWLVSRGQQLIHKDAIKIKGMHNVKNALALFAVAEAAGINLDACRSVLKTFPGLPHRCTFVRELDGVTYINDSKATNVGAAESALLGLAPDFDKIILIAGGDSKGAELADFGALLDRYVDVLVLIGRDAALIAQHTHKAEKIFAPSLEEAVDVAQMKAGRGDLVLLSPACASLDMFANYEERGKLFAKAVNRLVSWQ